MRVARIVAVRVAAQDSFLHGNPGAYFVCDSDCCSDCCNECGSERCSARFLVTQPTMRVAVSVAVCVEFGDVQWTLQWSV